MVTDLAKELMPEDAATFLKNVITDYNKGVNSAGQDHNAGLITPVQSNVNSAEFDGFFPSGNSLTIGSHYDRKLNQFFWCIWSAGKQHQIWVYDANTNVGTLAFESSLFNFDPRYLVTSTDLVVANITLPDVNVKNFQRLFYFNDGNQQPRKLNIDRAIAGEYATATNLRTPDQFMLLVQYPPLDVVFTNSLPNPDPAYLYNFVQNKLLQFQYHYNYEDGETSTESATSSLYYSVNTAQNFAELTMDAGSTLVAEVVLSFRETNTGDWKEYDRILRSDIVANVIYPYDISTNTFIYQFFNNQQYNVKDQHEANRLFSDVPLKSKAQAFTEQNLLLLGNNLKGYDNIDPVQLALPDVTVNYDEYEGLTLTVTGSVSYAFINGTNFIVDLRRLNADTGLADIIHTYTINGGSANPFIINETISSMDFGDKVFLYVTSRDGNLDTFNTRVLAGVYSGITLPLDCGTGNFSISDVSTDLITIGANIPFNTVVLDPCATWSTVTNEDTCPNYFGGGHFLKAGGVYRFGIIAYDAALRSTFVQPLADGKVTIQLTQDAGKLQSNSITFDWNDMLLPDDFYYFKICRTKNLVIDRTLGMGYLQFAIINVEFLKYDNNIGNPVLGDTIVNVRFSIAPLITFNTDSFENTTTVYTWTQGDRVQFIRNGDGMYFDTATYGFLDVPLSNSILQPYVVFRCEYVAGLETLVDNALVQFYTPSKSDQNDIFYEIGDFIPLTRTPAFNVPAVSSTTINTWDTYPIYWAEPYVDDTVTDMGATPFEHHSVYATKTVPSNGEDIGRINVINTRALQQWEYASVQWSNAYLQNSGYNGLSLFKEENKKEYFKEYGGIQQLFPDYFKLLLLQETNCFMVQIARSLVTLADGTSQLVATSTFLSDPIEITGDFGCQNSESFVDGEDYLYWVDTERAAQVQFDWHSAVDISRQGLIKSYAERKLKYISNYNATESQTQTCRYDTYGMPALTATDFIKILVNGEWQIINLSGNVTDAEGVATQLTALGFDTFLSDGTEVYVYAPTETYGTMIFTNLDQEVIFTLEITCTLDYYHVLGGYDPKTKMYLNTFFNVLTKPSWTWNLAAGFETGDDVTLTIDVNDSPVEFTGLEINSIDDIVTDLNAAFEPDVFSVTNNGTGILVISNSGNVYGTISVNDDEFVAVSNFKLCDYSTSLSILEIEEYPRNVYLIQNGVTLPGTTVHSLIELTAWLATFGFTVSGQSQVAISTSQSADVWNSFHSVIEDEDFGYDFIATNCTLLSTQYTNNEYTVDIERSETIGYSVTRQTWSGMYAYTPEFYCNNDGHLHALSMITFNQGTPYFHNLNTVTTYNTFYGTQTDQVVTVVCNQSPVTEKRFLTNQYNSKSNTTNLSGIKYGGYLVTTSDFQNSSIPVASYEFREGWYYSVFYLNTTNGFTIFTGEMLRGTWLELTLLRDTEQRSVYNELSQVVIFFESSEKSIR